MMFVIPTVKLIVMKLTGLCTNLPSADFEFLSQQHARIRKFIFHQRVCISRKRAAVDAGTCIGRAGKPTERLGNEIPPAGSGLKQRHNL
jgi:hypothetical protein